MTDVPESQNTTQNFTHPVVRRFLQMVARPDLKAEYPEQFEKHWENKGRSGIVRMLGCHILGHPCELTFSLFFDGDDVIQTGIVIKYQGEPLLNEVQKGDILNYRQNKRIDPVAFLKINYPNAGPGLPADTQSFALETDDDSEPEVLRAVTQLTGKSEHELWLIWNDLLVANDRLRSKDRVPPIIKSWLKKERDRIDLQYLRFAELLLPRTGDVMEYAMGTHTCVVATKRMTGRQMRALADATEPEWWGGMFFGMNQGQLGRVPHDQKDRLLLMQSLHSDAEYPVEEIFIDDRHIYSVLMTGEEALVWRTLHQVPAGELAAMPVVPQASPKESGEARLARLTPKPLGPESDSALPEPTAPEAHPYRVARAEKAYMAALRGKSAELKALRKDYVRLVYESDSRRFAGNPADLCLEIQGAIDNALGRDAGAIQREAALIEAYVMVFLDEAG